MTLKLPTTLAMYFDAERRQDAEALSLRFTERGVVKDEGALHSGRAAIATWISDAWKKYRVTTEPRAVATEGPTTIVTCHVAGNFPGSPLDLRYHFALEGDLISRLEVTL